MKYVELSSFFAMIGAIAGIIAAFVYAPPGYGFLVSFITTPIGAGIGFFCGSLFNGDF